MGDNKRILHVPRRFVEEYWGGTESVLMNLCKMQQEAGFSPEIYTSLALSDTKNELWRGVPVRRFGYCYPFLGLSEEENRALDMKGGNLLSLSLFGSLLCQKDVRIYHAHVIKRMGGIVYTAAMLRRKPCVASVHGNIFDVHEEEAQSLVAPIQYKGHLEWGKAFGWLFQSRALLEKVDAIACVGYSEYYAAKKALPHGRVHFVPNGVNPHEFVSGLRDETRERLGFKPKDFVVGLISRIEPQKAQLDLLKAVRLLVPKYPHLRVMLQGPMISEQYEKQIHRYIRQYEMGEYVRILPQVPAASAAIADSYAAMDAFVLPSRHEPFGIVALEAWSAKKPLIASFVGGLKFLVEDDVNGLFFQQGKVEQLAEKIEVLMKNPKLCKRLAEEGHDRVLKKYTWPIVNEKLEAVYLAAEEHCRSKHH